ncbi:acetyltransferase family protein, partial [Escherichia coli 90.2281]
PLSKIAHIHSPEHE